MKNSMKFPEACFELELKANIDFAVRLRNDIGEELMFGGNATEYFLDRGKTSHVYNEAYCTVRYAERNLQQHSKFAFM